MNRWISRASRVAATLLAVAASAACAAGPRAATAPIAPPPSVEVMDRQILVTFEPLPSLGLPRAGSSARNYEAAPGYRATVRTRKLARQLGRDYGLKLVSEWPIVALGVHCVVFEVADAGLRGDVIDRLADDRRVESVEPMQLFSVQGRSGGDPYREPPARLRHARARGGPPLGERAGREGGGHRQRRGHEPPRSRRTGGHCPRLRTGGRRPAAGRAARHGGDRRHRLRPRQRRRHRRRGARRGDPRATRVLDGGRRRRSGGLLELHPRQGPLVRRRRAPARHQPQPRRTARRAARTPAEGRPGAGHRRGCGVRRHRRRRRVPRQRRRRARGPRLVVDGWRPARAPGELSAPGHEILSTVPGGSYDFFSGSSLAAAQVSGVAALLLEHRRIGPDRLATLLRETARGTGAGGAARVVDACAALARVKHGVRCAPAVGAAALGE